jgi:hypothetical protein
MAHNQQPQSGAESEEDEPVLVLRVFRVVFQPGVLIRKGGRAFFSGATRNAVSTHVQAHAMPIHRSSHNLNTLTGTSARIPVAMKIAKTNAGSANQRNQ